jgi:hypothetical protein
LMKSPFPFINSIAKKRSKKTKMKILKVNQGHPKEFLLKKRLPKKNLTLTQLKNKKLPKSYFRTSKVRAKSQQNLVVYARWHFSKSHLSMSQLLMR